MHLVAPDIRWNEITVTTRVTLENHGRSPPPTSYAGLHLLESSARTIRVCRDGSRVHAGEIDSSSKSFMHAVTSTSARVRERRCSRLGPSRGPARIAAAFTILTKLPGTSARVDSTARRITARHSAPRHPVSRPFALELGQEFRGADAHAGTHAARMGRLLTLRPRLRPGDSAMWASYAAAVDGIVCRICSSAGPPAGRCGRHPRKHFLSSSRAASAG